SCRAREPSVSGGASDVGYIMRREAISFPNRDVVMRLVQLLVVLSICLPAMAQSPPVEFKGVPLGASKEQLLDKFPGIKCYGDNCSLNVGDRIKSLCYNIPSALPSRSNLPDLMCIKRVSEELRFG